jgi:hypothetical protein
MAQCLVMHKDNFTFLQSCILQIQAACYLLKMLESLFIDPLTFFFFTVRLWSSHITWFLTVANKYSYCLISYGGGGSWVLSSGCTYVSYLPEYMLTLYSSIYIGYISSSYLFGMKTKEFKCYKILSEILWALHIYIYIYIYMYLCH